MLLPEVLQGSPVDGTSKGDVQACDANAGPAFLDVLCVRLRCCASLALRMLGFLCFMSLLQLDTLLSRMLGRVCLFVFVGAYVLVLRLLHGLRELLLDPLRLLHGLFRLLHALRDLLRLTTPRLPSMETACGACR